MYFSDNIFVVHPVASRDISHSQSVEDIRNDPPSDQDKLSKCRHIVHASTFDKPAPDHDIVLDMIGMSHKRIHIMYIHLSVSIKRHKSIYM